MVTASAAPETATATAADPLPRLAHRCWQALEVVHVVGYFAPEPAEAYTALGLRRSAGYFAARSAPMGAVSPGVTTATFYVFAPSLVEKVLPAAWSVAAPEAVLGARHDGVAATLHRVLGDPDVGELLALARTACEGLSAEGRALYGGHATLPWPEDPLLALWHAATLLREHRGDGHVAALLLAGLDPVEAIVSYGQVSGMTPFLQTTRGWSDEEWAAGVQRLRERGVLDDDGGLTEAGRALRRSVEDQTGRAAEAGWRHLGADGATRLLELAGPLRDTLASSDAFPAGFFSARRG